MSTKIFCDIADFKLIKKFNKKRIVKGFTTNPSLIRKAGAKSYELYCKKILSVCKKKPISFEVFGDNDESMIYQGLKISTWAKNIYVKVPVINSQGKFMGKVIKDLNRRKIKLNITAVYTAKQTRQILNLINKKTNVIISTDKRGLKYLDKEIYQFEIIDTPKLDNIFYLPLNHLYQYHF